MEPFEDDLDHNHLPLVEPENIGRSQLSFWECELRLMYQYLKDMINMSNLKQQQQQQQQLLGIETFQIHNLV